MTIEEFQERLKKLNTYDEFKKFYEELEENLYCLEGKRRGIQALGFHQINNSDVIAYIYDDGKSTGRSHVKQLYKYLRVSE